MVKSPPMKYSLVKFVWFKINFLFLKIKTYFKNKVKYRIGFKE